MSLTQTRSRASDDEILICIDRGLEKVGPNVKHLAYWHLQKIGHIKRADIPRNPDKFAAGLKSLYHESAPAVERAILSEINAAFELHQNQLEKAITEASHKELA